MLFPLLSNKQETQKLKHWKAHLPIYYELLILTWEFYAYPTRIPSEEDLGTMAVKIHAATKENL